MIYWVSRAGPAASLRIYWDRKHAPAAEAALLATYLSAPYGVSFFPKELIQPPIACASLVSSPAWRALTLCQRDPRDPQRRLRRRALAWRALCRARAAGRARRRPAQDVRQGRAGVWRGAGQGWLLRKGNLVSIVEKCIRHDVFNSSKPCELRSTGPSTSGQDASCTKAGS
jgi:hypothetical protein